MSSSPLPPPTSSATDRGGPEIVSYGTGSSRKSVRSFTLVEAMKAADIIREAFRKRNDPEEVEQMVPPGTWQGVTAFAATGLLLTPFRRSILQMTGPRGPFQGFVDLVVTPILAVGAAQVGLVVGTLYGSSYYLDRLAMDAATTTKMSSNLGSSEFLSVRYGQDDKIRYSPTTESLAVERDNTVAELCQELLSLSSPPSPSPESSFQNELSQNTISLETEIQSFDSWDPRSKTMKSLLHAVNNCRRRE